MSEPISLRQASVSRCLEKKILFMGYELIDVLVIFLFLAALNLMFGRTQYRFVLVWLPTVALAMGLRIAKRGKPDGFLIHWIRYRVRPRALFAFYEPSTWKFPSRFKKREVKS